MQICPTCSTENPKGAGFCRSCGTPLPQALEQRQNMNNPPAPPPSNSKPPAGQSRLSRLAAARQAKEQSQPKTEGSGSEGASDWFGSLRSDAAAAPILVGDDEDEAPSIAQFEDTAPAPSFSGENSAGSFYSSISEVAETPASFGEESASDLFFKSLREPATTDLQFPLEETSPTFGNKSPGELSYKSLEEAPTDFGNESPSDLFFRSLEQPALLFDETAQPQSLAENNSNLDEADFSATLESLRSQPMSGPLFAPEAAEPEPLLEAIFEKEEAPGSKVPAEFDPRYGATGYLPDWLKELETQRGSAEALPSVSPSASFPLNAADNDDASLLPFNLNEAQTPKANKDKKVVPADEINGVPEWLREISASPGQGSGKAAPNPPEWLKDLESQNTTKPNIEGTVPNWLRDISDQAGPKTPSRPTFGDDEVAATLNFAFGDDSDVLKKPFDESNDLPDLNVPPGFAKKLPPEALRTGLTGQLGDLPPSSDSLGLPSYLTEALAEEASKSESGMPPLPNLDNLFVEETTQGQDIPFSLPPLPQFTEDAAAWAMPENQSENKFLWGSGLAPWLRGLTLPSLPSDEGENLPPLSLSTSFPVIGLPPEEENFARPGLAPIEHDMASMFDEENSSSITTEELQATAKTDGVTRFKDAQPFSLRDMMRQTDSLAENIEIEEPSKDAVSRFGDEPGSLSSLAPDYAELEPGEQKGNSFSLSDFSALRQSFDAADYANLEEEEEVAPLDLPVWLQGLPLPTLEGFSAMQAASPSAPTLAVWLQGLALPTLDVPFSPGSAIVTPAAIESYPPLEAATAAHEDLPEWLRSTTASEPAHPVPSVIEAAIELPSFDLAGPEPDALQAAPTKPLFVPSLPPMEGDEEEEEAETELQPFDFAQFDNTGPGMPTKSGSVLGNTLGMGEPDEEQLPDWLKSNDFATEAGNNIVAKVTPAAPQPTSTPAPVSPPADDDMPPWLQAMVGGGGQAAPAPIPNKPESRYSSMFAGVSRAEEEQSSLPDWLQDSAASPAAPPAVPEQVEEVETDAELERLLKGFETASEADDGKPAEMPRWLQGQKATTEPEFELSEDLPDWLKADAAAAETQAELPIITDRYNQATYGPPPKGIEVPTPPLAFNDLNSELNQTNPSILGKGFLDDVEAPAWIRSSGSPVSPEPSVSQTVVALPGSGATGALPGWFRTVGPSVAEPETLTATQPFVIPGSLPSLGLPPQLASAAVLAALLNPDARVDTTTLAPMQHSRRKGLKFNLRLVLLLVFFVLLLMVLFVALKTTTG